MTRDEEDRDKDDLWDTCNDAVIGWIMGSRSKPIKQTIMYMMAVREIWLILERRFSISIGSLKYKLNKELYETKQVSSSINEYYTVMKRVWEESESLGKLPTLNGTGEEVTRFLEAFESRKKKRDYFNS